MAMIGNGHDLIVSHPMHLQPFIKTTGQMSKFVALLLSAHVVPTPGCGGDMMIMHGTSASHHLMYYQCEAS